MRPRIAWTFAIAVAVAAYSAGAVLFAQTGSPRSVFDGVYTAEQATRGESAYLNQCARCHEQSLAGTEWGPALIGNDFVAAWTGMTAGRLFQRINLTMPPDGPGRVGGPQSADILSFILKMNDFPAGAQVLEPNVTVLNTIRIDRKQ